MRVEAGDYVQCLFEKDNGHLHEGGYGYAVCRLDAATHSVKEDTVYVVMGTGAPSAYPAKRVILVRKAEYAEIPRSAALELLADDVEARTETRLYAKDR